MTESKKLFLVKHQYEPDSIGYHEALDRGESVEFVELSPELEEKIIYETLNDMIKRQKTKEGKIELRNFYEGHKPIILLTMRNIFQKLRSSVE